MYQHRLAAAAFLLAFLHTPPFYRTTSFAMMSSQSNDDPAALKVLVARFFHLYAKKDIDGFMTLWSEKSPDYASRQQTMHQLFAVRDHSFANIIISRIKVDGDRARCRVDVDVRQVDLKTKQSKSQRLTRAFVWSREEKAWKVWQYYPAVEDLATALIASETEEARKVLLEEEKELVTSELAQALLTQGNRAYAQGNFSRSLAIYLLCQKVSEEIGDRYTIARTLNNIATIHQSQGRYVQGLELYEKSLKISTDLGDQSLIADTLGNIGNVHYQQGNYDQTLELYEKSLKIQEALGIQTSIARTLSNIGSVHNSRGNYDRALELYEKSLKILEDMVDQSGIARVLNNIANVHYSQDNFAQALKLYERSLKISEALGAQDTVAIALHNIGAVHSSQGNYASAMASYEKSLKICEALGDQAGIAHSLNNLGNVNNSQGNHSRALELYERSLKICEALGDQAGIARTLNGMGITQVLQGNYPQASDLYEKSLKISEALGHQESIAVTLSNIGNLHQLQGDHARALESCQRSLAIAEILGDLETAFRANWIIGGIHKDQGRKEEAMVAFKQAIERLERVRRQISNAEEDRLTYLHAQGKDDVYQSLVSLLVEQGKTAEALSTLERARSKQLLDGIRLSALAVNDENMRTLLQKCEGLEQALESQERERLREASKPVEKQDKTKLGNLTHWVAGTRTELLQVMNRIHDANPDYERFVNIKPTELRRVQSQLPTRDLLVEYLPLETALVVFLVTHDGMEARTVAVPRKRLEEMMQDVHGHIERIQREGGESVRDWDWESTRARRLREALTALYGYLIAPIQKEIAKADTVIFVPSGILHYLPFQALARESTATDGSAKAELSFLTEEKRIATLPSLDLWWQIAEQEKRNQRGGLRRLSGFGNPDGTLPEAEREVKRVGALFTDSLVFTGAGATRKELEHLPMDISIVHLATHGHLSERDFNECHLVMANDEKLKLGDVYGLAGKYPAQMTVLSACQTAVGRRDPGNEVTHLANAFVEAGSTTIIATLWKVSDESTTKLMEKFYQELKSGKSKAEAKRQAEIHMLKNKRTAHPYFWAPFVLIGDWR